MNQRLLDAYLAYSGEQARAGIIDDSLTENLDDDRPLEDRIEDILRAAGRLPEGWDREANHAAVDDWRDVPEFADEDEEAEFWLTHSLGGSALESLGTLDDEALPPPRSRRRRPVVLDARDFLRENSRQTRMSEQAHRPRIRICQRDWLRAS